MERSEFVGRFDSTFAGRRDCYATGFPKPGNPSKYAFVPERDANGTDQPLTPELLWRHLRGEICVGVYPIKGPLNGGDLNTVEWFACDYDGETYAAAYEGARTQQAKLEKEGLHVYLERSRSGNGVHIWAWFQEAVPAALVRQAILPLLDLKHIAYDRIFPVQDELTGKGYGNLICLPFYGKAVPEGNGVFLDAEGKPVPPRDFLRGGPHRNAKAVLELIAKKHSKRPAKLHPTFDSTTVGRPMREATPVGYGPPVTGALKVISQYGCSFMRDCYVNRDTIKEPQWNAMLQVCTHFEHGRDLAHLMSAGKRYNPGAVDEYYTRKLQNDRIGCRYIAEHWPHLACQGCTKAPHHLASKSILELAAGKRNEMEQAGSFAKDIARVRALEAGAPPRGLHWGIPGLDKYTRLRRGELVAIGAAPSMGKTWFFVNAMITLARRGTTVFGFSAETGEESLRVRLLANAAKVDSRKLTGESERRITTAEWERIEAAEDELSQLPIYLDYTSLSADDVLAQVESVVLRKRMPLDSHYVVMFDYLQFGAKMLGDQTEYDRISRLSTEFKFSAKILDQTVAVFSQLRREAEGSKTPDMTWWKNSGRIESDQDLGIIWVGDRVEGGLAPRQAWLTKQREGLANLAIPFTLDQATGLYTWSGAEMRTERQPLIMTSED